MARPKEFDPETALDKALHLFWHQGYEATSVQNLLDFMGISRGSFYDTFGNKHALFLAALDRYRQNSHHKFVQTFVGGSGSFKENLANFFKNIIDEATGDTQMRGCFMTNSTVELAPHDADTAEQVASNRETVEDILFHALVQAQVNGEISNKTDARAMAQFLFNAIQGLRVVAKTTKDRQTLENIIQVTLSVLE